VSELLAVSDAAKESKMSEGWIKKEIREGRLIARKFGRKTRIEREEFERWIKRQPMKFVVTASVKAGSHVVSGSFQVIEKSVRVG